MKTVGKKTPRRIQFRIRLFYNALTPQTCSCYTGTSWRTASPIIQESRSLSLLPRLSTSPLPLQTVLQNYRFVLPSGSKVLKISSLINLASSSQRTKVRRVGVEVGQSAGSQMENSYRSGSSYLRTVSSLQNIEQIRMEKSTLARKKAVLY